MTLFGESAGSGSICAQLVSPQAHGLFQRAIMESWSCTSPANTMPAATAQARSLQYAADPKLGCTGFLPGSVVRCMRSKSAQQLIDVFAPASPGWCTDPGPDQYLNLQTVDGHYLPMSTRDAMYSGSYNHARRQPNSP